MSNKKLKGEIIPTVEKTAEELTAKIANIQDVEIIGQAKEEKNFPSFCQPIELLKEKVLRGANLSEKHDELTAKLASFKQFQFNDLATVQISDAKGRSMTTHNSRVIERFFVVCVEEYQNAINKIEVELNSLNF